MAPKKSSQLGEVKLDINSLAAAGNTTKGGSTNTINSYGTNTSITDSTQAESIVDKAPGGASANAVLINFLKGMIGPGALSLPLALKQGGLWAGVSLVFIFGILNTYCMLQLVKCTQHIARNKGKRLDYGQVAYEACATSFKALHPYRFVFKYICVGTIILLQIGICAVYYVFVATNVEKIVEAHSGFKADSTLWALIVLLPMGMINLVGSVKIMAFFSLLGNFCMIGSLAFIMQYLLRQPHLMATLPFVTNFEGVLMACGSVLYSFEGQAMVIPLMLTMRKPTKMLGPCGVLSSGMSLVTVAYAMCGFVGYITYGDDVEGSITLNLPPSLLFEIVRGLLIFVVYTGFLVQQYVIVTQIWPHLSKRLGLDKKLTPRGEMIGEGVFRTCLVLTECVVAIAVPKLDDIIPLIGATAGMCLAFIFPCLIDTLIELPRLVEERRTGATTWILVRNGLLITLGFVGLGCGLWSNIKHLT